MFVDLLRHLLIWRRNLVLRFYLTSPCCSTDDVGLWQYSASPFLCMLSWVSLRYSASLWQYWASPLSPHVWHGIIAVFGIAVVVFGLALVSSHLV